MIRAIAGRLRDERGMTLPELLVGMTVMLVVVGATLTIFEGFERTSRVNQIQNDAQQETRVAIDRIARELRNLAGPTPEQPQALDKATATDIVFQSVNPAGPNTGANSANVQRVRYCLDTSVAANNRIWKETQTWTTASAPAVPSTATCPGGEPWTAKGYVAEHIVNAGRPIFTYNSAVLNEITSIRMEIFVDSDTTRRPGASRLSSGVFLRNQNRPPTASFSATATGNRHVLLNGSASDDPEARALTYVWYDGSTKIGTGITYDYTAPATGSRTFTLKVYDPANLEGVSPAQVVNVT